MGKGSALLKIEGVTYLRRLACAARKLDNRRKLRGIREGGGGSSVCGVMGKREEGGEGEDWGRGGGIHEGTVVGKRPPVEKVKPG